MAGMKRSDWNQGWEFRKVADEMGRRLGDGPWRAVALPHDAMVHERRDPSTRNAYNTGYYPGGEYEYRRRFEADGDACGVSLAAEDADPWLLEFEGIYPGARVWINGRIAADQHYGYGDFTVDARPFLKPGANEIVVRVDNAQVPNSRWYSGSGIYRPVWLWRRDGDNSDYLSAYDDSAGMAFSQVIRPDAVRARTIGVDTDGTATVGVSVEGVTGETEDPMPDIVVRMDGPDKGSYAFVATGPADHEVRIAIPRARLWSPNEPNLYQLHVELRDPRTGAIIDRHDEHFGIRTLTCDARRGLRINGRRVALNGGCVHHDNGILGAATWDQAEFRRARILKAAGFNAVRSAHNPLSKAFLDACDRIGLMVMDEAFDMWWMHKTSHDFASHFRDEWAKELAAMIRKDRNRPSVVLYSIGNEIADTKSPRAAVQARRMVNLIRTLDGTRPVIDCVNTISLMLAAKTRAKPDQSDPRVEGEPGLNTTLEHASGPAMLTLIDRLMPLALRTGIMGRQTRDVFRKVDVAGLNYCKEGPAYFHRRNPERVFCASETYPQDIIRNWPEIKRLPYVIGDFVWTGWDYIGEASVSAWAYAGAREAGGWERQFGDRLGLAGIRTAPYRRYPALLGASGLVDITGRPTEQAFYRMIVTGLRHEPYITVRPMTLLYGGPVGGHNIGSRILDGVLNTLRLSGYDRRHGLNRTMRFIERGHDGVRSWSWRGFEDRTAAVQVFSGGDRVRLELNGRVVDEQPVVRCCAEFLLPYEPGELTAVTFDRDGNELGRDAIRSAGREVRLTATGVERLASPYARGDGRFREGTLIYIDLALTDGDGVVQSADDRDIAAALNESARNAGVVLEGVMSANPITPDEFADPRCTTYFGRAQAVLRMPGELADLPADAAIDVRADGLPGLSVGLGAPSS